MTDRLPWHDWPRSRQCKARNRQGLRCGLRAGHSRHISHACEVGTDVIRWDELDLTPRGNRA